MRDGSLRSDRPMGGSCSGSRMSSGSAAIGPPSGDLNAALVGAQTGIEVAHRGDDAEAVVDRAQGPLQCWVGARGGERLGAEGEEAGLVRLQDVLRHGRVAPACGGGEVVRPLNVSTLC